MKKNFLYSLVVLLITALLITGCSKNIVEEPVQDGIKLKTVAKTVYSILYVPAWLINPPEGETAVGIAWDSNKKKYSALDIAREFAVVSLSRNHGSFIVDKTAVLDLASQLDSSEKKADLKVVVSADTLYLNNIGKKLKPLAETSFHGYKLFLMGTQETDINNDLISVSASNLPRWCYTQNTTEDDNYVYVSAKAEDADLITAWKLAQENALRSLAQYRLQKVSALIKSTDDNLERAMLIETVTSNSNASFSRIWLYHKLVNNAPSYTVFMMLKSPKQN
ncbi:MAG: hypothetical protein FJ041_06600 [Candidatus Cloacimonetes bacterium]|nr:hypothetical protein [Candidatus Cloacimonadota bacterium]